jgi:hypothetical protein
MKYFSFLWIGIYLIGSLSCGVGAKMNCCAKDQKDVPAHSCHSTSEKSKGTPVNSNSFDLCCCSISSDLPKGVQHFWKTSVSSISFSQSFLDFVRHSANWKSFSESFLVSTKKIFGKDFIQLVFQPQAPPLKA